MKKYLKIDFSKRDVISTVCFTVVMILVLVLGNSFGYVSADDDVTLDVPSSFSFGSFSGSNTFNYVDYQASSIYDSSVAYFSNSSSTYRVNFLNFLNTYSIPSSGYYMNNVGGNDRDMDLINNSYNYFVTGDQNAMWLVLVPTSCTVVGGTIYLPDTESAWYFSLKFSYDSANDTWVPMSQNGHTQFAQLLVDWNNQVTHSSGYCYNMICSANDVVFYSSNLYFVKQNVQDNYSIANVSNFLNGSNSDFEDVNYFLTDSQFGYDNGSGSSGETSSNNLYLNNPFWVYSMPTYSTSNRGSIVTNNGTTTFNAAMTNYQLEHPSEFELHFTFQITVKYTADGGWSGGSHGFYLLGATPFNALGSDTVSRTGTFKYRPSGGSDTYSALSLEHFTGSYSFNTITNYRYIFANCYLDGDTSKDDFLTWYTRNYSSDGVQFSSIVLKCTAELFDAYQNYSGPCIYQYDFISGTASKLSDSMGTNNNPYDYQNQDSYSDTVTGAYGYVTQTNNNNQTVTITNSNVNTNDISNVIGDIGDEDDSSSLINKFSSLLSLSSWVAVFATAMSFVPVAFWTNLVEYFAVALGILSTFLVLRYILNLLT